jgi:hypothetical protein
MALVTQGFQDGAKDLELDLLRFMLQVCQNGGENLEDWISLLEARIVREENNWKGSRVIHGSSPASYEAESDLMT